MVKTQAWIRNQVCFSKMPGEMACCLKEGHFAKGSMGQKVEVAIEFINKGGEQAIITSINTIDKAVNGQAGTVISA